MIWLCIVIVSLKHTGELTLEKKRISYKLTFKWKWNTTVTYYVSEIVMIEYSSSVQFIIFLPPRLGALTCLTIKIICSKNYYNLCNVLTLTGIFSSLSFFSSRDCSAHAQINARVRSGSSEVILTVVTLQHCFTG